MLLSLELYSESIYMVQSGGMLFAKLANSTTFRNLNESIWDPSYQKSMEDMLESAYHYGRDFISSGVRQALGTTPGENGDFHKGSSINKFYCL